MRVSKAPEERRAELICAARRLFDEKGIDKTRISDIVGRVGVAQGVFYYYFSSKEEMVQTVAAIVARETDRKARHILDGPGDYCRKLAGFIELFIDSIDKFLGDDETSMQPLAGHRDVYGGLNGAVAEKLYANLETLVRQGMQEQRFATPYPWQTAQVLIAGLLGLAQQQLPPRRMIYAMVEQAMGLPGGNLTKYMRGRKEKSKSKGA